MSNAPLHHGAGTPGAHPGPHARPTVLVTGAAGLVGSRIAADLAQDFDLRLTDREAGEVAGLPVAAVDILDFKQVRQAMEGVDAVVHLAICSVIPLRGRLPQWEIDDRVMRVNVMGTQHVFEAARQAGVKRIVYMSSLTIALGSPSLGTFAVDAPPRPRELYACTKLFGEHLGELYARQHELSVICLRLGQPVPTPNFDYDRLRNPLTRKLAVGYADIAQAVRCGLRTPAHFAVANVVSTSDLSTPDLADGATIGYQPRMRFSEDGFTTDTPAPTAKG